MEHDLSKKYTSLKSLKEELVREVAARRHEVKGLVEGCGEVDLVVEEGLRDEAEDGEGEVGVLIMLMALFWGHCIS